MCTCGHAKQYHSPDGPCETGGCACQYYTTGPYPRPPEPPAPYGLVKPQATTSGSQKP